MRRQLLAFDLDGTLAESKSPIGVPTAGLLAALLEHYDVCVISGGSLAQIRTQVVELLPIDRRRLGRIHLLPTSGSRCYRFDDATSAWVVRFSEDLTDADKRRIVDVVTAVAKDLGLWEPHPTGEILEDRGGQITFSALGQEAPTALKYAWDPDGAKRERLRSRLAPLLADFAVRTGGTTSIDVTRQGVDKASGIGKLATYLGLAAADILFFGDQLQAGGNDNPVRSLGVDCISVRDAQDTVVALESILAVAETVSRADGMPPASALTIRHRRR